ncbi:uncharacterized protein [Halyomorpha halys]|uniref:uncharacterized protein n=1 Tax=Halyomorpha halys TaxID=286706 RepID=UPI000D0C7CB5|nr:uncharacterized protein LOC112210557 [Halyomorpha halys]
MGFNLSNNEDFQRLFLLELLVDSVKFDYKKVNLSKSTLELLKQTCVRFNFLNFPVIEVCEEDFCQTQGDYKMVSDILFRNGKSCFFSLRGLPQRVQCLQLGATIVRQKDEPPPIIMGTTCITLDKGFVDVLNDLHHNTETGEASNSLKDVFPIVDTKGIKIGSLALLIRLSSFGKAIITHFKIPQEKEAGYMFANTNEPGKAQMKTPISLGYPVHNYQVSQPDNNIFYSGVSSGAQPGTGIPETVLGSTPMGESYPSEDAQKTSPMIYRGFPNTTPGVQSTFPGDGQGAFPGNAPGNFPGATPGTFPGTTPGTFTGAGAAPGNFPAAAPDNFHGAAPGNFPGAAPGNFPGAAPGNFPGAAPGNFPGAAPGNFPGNAPGNFTVAAQGNFPGVAPGNFPGAAPGTFHGGSTATFDVYETSGFFNGMPTSETNSWGTTGNRNEGLHSGLPLQSMRPAGEPDIGLYQAAIPQYPPGHPEIGMGENMGNPQYSPTNLLNTAIKSNIDNNIRKGYKELSVSINGHEFTINILRKSRPKKEKAQPLKICGRIPEIETSDSEESTIQESIDEVEEEYKEKIDEEKDEEIPKIRESNSIKKENKINPKITPEPQPVIAVTVQQNNPFKLCECDIALPKGFRLPEPPAQPTTQSVVATAAAPPTPPPTPTEKVPQTQVDSPQQSGSNHAIVKNISPSPPITSMPQFKEKEKLIKKNLITVEKAPKNIYCLQPDCPMGFPWPPNIPQEKKIIRVPCCSQMPMHPGYIGLNGEQIVFQMSNGLTPDIGYNQNMLNINDNKSPYVLKLGSSNLPKCKCTKMIMELPPQKLKVKKIERDDQDTQYLESDIPFLEPVKVDTGKKGKGKKGKEKKGKGKGKKGGKKGKKK